MQHFLGCFVTLGSCGVFVVFLLGKALAAELAIRVGTGCLLLAILAYAWLLLLWKLEAPGADAEEEGSDA